MNVEIAKWGNSAAVRVPAAALKESGLQVGQRLRLRVEQGRLTLEPDVESLESLLSRITPDNRHEPLLDDASRGAEAW